MWSKTTVSKRLPKFFLNLGHDEDGMINRYGMKVCKWYHVNGGKITAPVEWNAPQGWSRTKPNK
jgi:hypothetical protein